MNTERHLNVRLIELKIIDKGWTWKEAALRLEINKHTLKRIRDGRNVHNGIIQRVSSKLDIPLEQLVVWPTNDDNLRPRQNILA